MSLSPDDGVPMDDMVPWLGLGRVLGFLRAIAPDWIARLSRSAAFLSVAFTAALIAPPAQAQTDYAVAAHYPPMMIADSPDRPGANVEILIEAARRQGRRVTVEFLPFARAIKTLQRGQNVLQPALFRKPERESLYTWVASTNVLTNTFNTLGPPIDTLDQARRLEWIGVETGAALDLVLTGEAFTNLSRVDRPQVNAQKLLAGHIDAWAVPSQIARAIWSELGYTAPLIVGATVSEEINYIVASPDTDPEIVMGYRAAIAEMRADGTLQAINEKYGWQSE